MDRVNIKSSVVETNSDYFATFSATVELDNNEAYQLRVIPDSVGNVYVWIDHRKRGKWEKLVELLNTDQRSVK